MALTARYATTCGRCAQSIAPGEEITDIGGARSRRWAHLACAAQDADPYPTAVPGQLALDAEDHPSTPTTTAVWTDGACSGNPGPGGWAWATRDGRQGSGSEARTTNQRMEIAAALEAVRALDGPLVIHSDSTYVVNCFRDGWWKGWLARDWVNSAKKPVANRDLWEPLIDAVRARGDVEFRWVKGHSGDEMNDLVDSLAVEAGRRQDAG